MTNTEKLSNAVKNGNVGEVKYLLSETDADPTYNNNFYIKDAVQCNHIEITKLLLDDKRVNPCMSGNFCLEYACLRNYNEIIILLMADDRINSHISYDQKINIIECLNKYNEFGILIKLIEDYVIAPDIGDNLLIQIACEGNHTYLIEYLIQFESVDVHSNMDQAFRYSASNCNFYIYKLLYYKSPHTSWENVSLSIDYIINAIGGDSGGRINILTFLLEEVIPTIDIDIKGIYNLFYLSIRANELKVAEVIYDFMISELEIKIDLHNIGISEKDWFKRNILEFITIIRQKNIDNILSM